MGNKEAKKQPPTITRGTIQDGINIDQRIIYNKNKSDADWYKKSIAIFDLNERFNKIEVRVFIEEDDDPDWVEWVRYVKEGLLKIETSAPRFKFILENKPKKARGWINIARLDITDPVQFPQTCGFFAQKDGAVILLKHNWPYKQRSSVHEVLHALGFMHEHNRKDGKKYFKNFSKPNDVNFKQDKIAVTKVDPFSIMLYPETKGRLEYRKNKNSIFDLVSESHYNEMSEYDKLSLNLVYPPTRGDDYNPEIGENGLVYCGRKIMNGHNKPSYDFLTEGLCGPNNGPNCNSCRVLKSPKSESAKEKGIWQGMSGLFYCGKKFDTELIGHNGVCGPNNGEPCRDCRKFIKLKMPKVMNNLFN